MPDIETRLRLAFLAGPARLVVAEARAVDFAARFAVFFAVFLAVPARVVDFLADLAGALEPFARFVAEAFRVAAPPTALRFAPVDRLVPDRLAPPEREAADPLDRLVFFAMGPIVVCPGPASKYWGRKQCEIHPSSGSTGSGGSASPGDSTGTW
jgi:hypothetical protein